MRFLLARWRDLLELLPGADRYAVVAVVPPHRTPRIIDTFRRKDDAERRAGVMQARQGSTQYSGVIYAVTLTKNAKEQGA